MQQLLTAAVPKFLRSPIWICHGDVFSSQKISPLCHTNEFNVDMILSGVSDLVLSE